MLNKIILSGNTSSAQCQNIVINIAQMGIKVTTVNSNGFIKAICQKHKPHPVLIESQVDASKKSRMIANAG